MRHAQAQVPKAIKKNPALRPLSCSTGIPSSMVWAMACELISPTPLDRPATYKTEKYSLKPYLIEVLTDNYSIEETT